MPIETPHLAWPVARDPTTGSLRVVEQDTPEEVLACENVIVRCPTGFREDRPEFGWPFPTFRNMPVNPGELETALRTWEPRGTTNVTEFIDLLTPGADALIAETEVEDIGA